MSAADDTPRPAPESVVASEEVYRQLFSASPRAMWVYEVDSFRFLAVNDAAVRQYGYSREEFLAMTIADIRPAEDVPELRRVAREVGTKGYTDSGSWRHRRKDGSILEVDITSHAIDFGGRLARLVLLTDVTAQRAAEAATRASEARFRAVFDQSAVGMVLVDDDGIVLETNAAFQAMLGYSADELRGRPSAALSPAEDASVTREPVRDLKAGLRDDVSVEKRYLRRDGSVVWASLTVSRLDVEGERPRLLGVVQDITSRRAAEEALQESEVELRAVFGAMTDVIVVLDADARYVKIAPSSPDLLYRPSGDLLGRRIRDVFPPEIADHFERIVHEALASDAPVPFEYELEIAGQPRWFSGNASRIRRERDDADPARAHVLWVARDVTAGKQLEAQLRQAQKMEAVGLLAGGIAHDFNNLLTVITAYGQLLREELADAAERHEESGEVLKAAARGAELTRQLLAFGRKQVLKPRLLDVNAVISGVRPMLGRLLGADVDFVTHLAPSLGMVEADPGQLEQVLLNLTANAGDAMPSGGTLTLETANADVDAAAARAHPGLSPGLYVVVTVRDTGTGMSEATRLRVFEPFFTTKGTGKGTGLGLATVYGIIKQSGGYVAVESAPGEGTSFSIYLPLAGVEKEGRAPAATSTPVFGTPASAAPVVAAPAGRPDAPAPVVLLVDDEDAVRSAARRILEREGYEVLEASQGGEAHEIYLEHADRIRLLLTDLLMPVLGGRALAQRIRARDPELPVLFISGYSSQDARGSGPIIPGAPLLAKPFTAEQLVAAVAAALRNAAPSRPASEAVAR
jgi:PAS domain S-box-containing protein